MSIDLDRLLIQSEEQRRRAEIDKLYGLIANLTATVERQQRDITRLKRRVAQLEADG